MKKKQIGILFNRLIVWCLNGLLGRMRYRVKFIYKSKSGREIFNFNRTVSVRDNWYIEQHRDIKKEMGCLYQMEKIRPYLNNGTLHVEPVCCLGRYKAR